jgi:hypothetical protein
MHKPGHLLAFFCLLLTSVGVTTIALAGAASSSVQPSTTLVGMGRFSCDTSSGQTHCRVTSSLSLAGGDYLVSIAEFRWPSTSCTEVTKGIKDVLPGQTLADLKYPSDPEYHYPLLFSVATTGGTVSVSCVGGGADASFPYGLMLTATPSTFLP